MTIKIRDAGGVLRTIDTVKVRGPDGILRTIGSIRVRGPDNVLREVFAAGGTPAPTNPTYISPPSNDTSGSTISATAYFTAYSSGGVPTAYSWGLIEGNGSVVSGRSTATAQLRIQAASGYNEATFYCDVTIGGTVYRATCTMSRYRTGPGGGGGGDL